MKPTRLFTTAAALSFTLAGFAHAGIVTWGAPTTISADTDVSTAGTLLGALNLDLTAASPTINGVTFTGAGGFSGASGPFNWSGFTGLSFAGLSGHPGLSVPYQDLLRSSAVGNGANMALNGLIFGNTYELQIWADDNGSGNTAISSAVAGNSVTLDNNTTDLPGGFGQYVIGTFVADGPTQNVTLNGRFNGIQLRETTPVVPEPGTALFGLALLGATLVRRRR